MKGAFEGMLMKERIADRSYLAGVTEKINPDSPDLNQVLGGIEEHIQSAREQGFTRYEWIALDDFCQAAKIALKEQNISKACWNFMFIGRFIALLETESSSEINHLYEWAYTGMKLNCTERERNKGLQHKQKTIQSHKNLVQGVARIKWKDDKNEQIRISEMCEFVWNNLLDNVPKVIEDKYFPDRSSNLKPWIREIAPDYAKVRGAPKKVTK